MPNRFDAEIEELRRADLSPSERLVRLAETVTRMADELRRTASELADDERRHTSVPVQEERRVDPPS